MNQLLISSLLLWFIQLGLSRWGLPKHSIGTDFTVGIRHGRPRIPKINVKYLFTFFWKKKSNSVYVRAQSLTVFCLFLRRHFTKEIQIVGQNLQSLKFIPNDGVTFILMPKILALFCWFLIRSISGIFLLKVSPLKHAGSNIVAI